MSDFYTRHPFLFHELMNTCISFTCSLLDKALPIQHQSSPHSTTTPPEQIPVEAANECRCHKFRRELACLLGLLTGSLDLNWLVAVPRERERLHCRSGRSG